MPSEGGREVWRGAGKTLQQTSRNRRPLTPAAADVKGEGVVVVLIDGGAAYEYEHADLRYWESEPVEEACRLIGATESGR